MTTDKHYIWWMAGVCLSGPDSLMGRAGLSTPTRWGSTTEEYIAQTFIYTGVYAVLGDPTQLYNRAWEWRYNDYL